MTAAGVKRQRPEARGRVLLRSGCSQTGRLLWRQSGRPDRPRSALRCTIAFAQKPRPAIAGSDASCWATAQAGPHRAWRGPMSQSERAAGGAPGRGSRRPGVDPRRALSPKDGMSQEARDPAVKVVGTPASNGTRLNRAIAATVWPQRSQSRPPIGLGQALQVPGSKRSTLWSKPRPKLARVLEA
jgi:hypothetical protein